MISMKAIKDSSVASKYYSQSDYYTSGDKEQIVSEWGGEGAKLLDLKGEVNIDDFRNIMDGQLPSGETLGKPAANGSKEHKKGWDIVFSAPKSVSVLALAGGDNRLVKAHQTAVKTAMQYLEKNYLVTRQSKNGKVSEVNTGNLVSASFLHTTSRKLDPQLHTHNVVMNATQRKDGAWRSVESRRIYDNSMLLGQIYRTELAALAKSLGYEIEVDSKKGTFELKDVPEEVRKAFSKRRAEIENAAKVHGYTTAKGMDNAAVRSRDSKKNVSKADIERNWKDELEQLGFDPQAVIDKAKEREKASDGEYTPEVNKGGEHEPPGSSEPEDHSDQPSMDDEPPGGSYSESPSALKDVEFAFKNLAEREAVFSEEQLINSTLKWGMGNYGINAIGHAIATLKREKQILPAVLPDGNKAFTTEQALKTEKYIISLMRQGKGSVKSIASKTLIKEEIEGKGLEKGQEAAARLILGSRDRVVGIQGYAGSGKTYMLDKVRGVAEGNGFTVRGFAPTGTAAEQLQNDSGIESQTLASHLYSLKNTKDHKPANNEIWIVDEAGLANGRDMASLLTYSKNLGARLVLVGDTQQIGAIDWGKPFYQLMRGGMKYAEMKEIRRQKDSPDLLDAVYHSIDKNPRQALAKIKDSVYEIGKTDERINSIVEHFLSLSPDEREQMLVLIPDNETRAKVNQQIQAGLQKEGTVGETKLTTNILVSKGLTRMEKGNTRFYKPGMVVHFGRDNRSLGVTKETDYQVVSVGEKEILLRDNEGKQIKWDPDKVAGRAEGGVEVYSLDKRSIGEGDLIRWKKKDKELGLKNGYKGDILRVDGNIATIRFQNGKEVDINLKDNKLWDLGYATTIFSAQGATYKNVIINAESWRRNLINQKTFYVGISRAKSTAHIYTDNQKDLADGIAKRSGDKTAAIEGRNLNYGNLMGDDGLIKDVRQTTFKDQVSKVVDKVKDKIDKFFDRGMGL